MRMYESAWTQLKEIKRIRITAAVHLHPRIYKAIRKEKDMDTIYKYELSEAGEKATLSFSSNGMVLTINMKVSTSLKSLNPSNLF